MLRSLTIQNFRGIGDMQMRGIARANLLTGVNGVGKTSLLEAIFLACNPVPHQVAWLVVHRQHPPYRTTLGTPPWRELFRQLKPALGLEVQAQSDTEPHRWSVALTEQEPTGAVPVALPPGSPFGLGLSASSVPQAVLSIQVHVDGRGSESTALRTNLIWSSDNALLALPAQKPPVPSAAFLVGFGNHEEDCAAFGALQAAGEDQVQIVLDALRPIEPRLRRLFITVDPNPRLNADLGPEDGVMPLDLLGDGLRRAVTFMVTVLSHKAAVVLIDEIENGLHHSHYAQLWTSLCAFARSTDIQLFAVTHSAEFLHHALSANPNDSAMAAWRLDRGETGEVAATRFAAEDALAALSFGVELR